MSSKGETTVSSRENLCFYSMLLASSAGIVQSNLLDVHDADSFGLAIFLICFWVLLGTLLLWPLAAVVARYQLHKAKARVLNRDEAPVVFEILTEECSRLGIAKWRVRKLYVTDWNTRVSARVLGGFGFKIVVSGGMCVLAARKRETARIIFDHEIAHLLNSDTKLWIFVGAVVLGLITSLIDPPSVPHAIAANMTQIGLLVFLLRRREYFADAVAVNCAESTAMYLSILPSGIDAERSGWFHPAAEYRKRAIEDGSPVLRTSGTILFLYAVIIFGGFWQTRTILLANYPYPSYEEKNAAAALLMGFVVLNIVPAFGAISELSKGCRRKHPLSGRTALNSSSLARFVGR